MRYIIILFISSALLRFWPSLYALQASLGNLAPLPPPYHLHWSVRWPRRDYTKHTPEEDACALWNVTHTQPSNTKIQNTKIQKHKTQDTKKPKAQRYKKKKKNTKNKNFAPAQVYGLEQIAYHHPPSFRWGGATWSVRPTPSNIITYKCPSDQIVLPVLDRPGLPNYPHPLLERCSVYVYFGKTTDKTFCSFFCTWVETLSSLIIYFLKNTST